MKLSNLDNISFKLIGFKDKIINIQELLVFCTENSCSDLYIKVGERPYINKYGKIYEVPSVPINDLVWNDFTSDAINSENNAHYTRQWMLDFSYQVEVPETSQWFNSEKQTFFRYRVSAGYSMRRNTATFRMITPKLPSFETLNFPEDAKNTIYKAFEEKTGIVIASGPTGSGKSSTLAACISDFTAPGKFLDNSMIITLEDPVEYVYNNTPSVRIIQKELAEDFRSFPLGIKQALREHPTMIVCGEIRDREGITTAVEAARTGHKVLTTLHSSTISQTISRLYFHLIGDDSGIGLDTLHDLITNMNLIICQRLVPSNNNFKLETQYLLFDEQVKSHLLKAIHSGGNIGETVERMFKDDNFKNAGVISPWH